MFRLKLGKILIQFGKDDCAMERCDYFTHYLRWGAAAMSHAAFHKATEECLHWQKRAMESTDERGNVPAHIEKMVLRLEKEVRA